MAKSRSGEHTGRLATATVKALSEMDQMWASVDAARETFYGARVASARPDGCFTTEEYAERYRMAYTGAHGALAEMAKRGLLDRIRFRAAGVDGRFVAKCGWMPKANQ